MEATNNRYEHIPKNTVEMRDHIHVPHVGDMYLTHKSDSSMGLDKMVIYYGKKNYAVLSDGTRIRGKCQISGQTLAKIKSKEI